MKTNILIAVAYLSQLISGYNILIHSSAGGRSHIRWLLEVSETLSDMGHTVTYLSDDSNLQNSQSNKIKKVSTGESPYKDAGIYFHDAINNLQKKSHQEVSAKLLDVLLMISYRANFNELHKFIEINRDLDLIICDFLTPACVDLALLKNIPLAINFQSFDVFGSVKPTYSSNLDDNFFDIIGLLKEYYSYHNTLKKLNLVRNSFGISNQNYLSADYSKTLNLVHSFSGLELSKVPSHFHLVGPIFNSTSPIIENEAILNILNSKKRIVYIAFGNNAQLPMEAHEAIIKSMSSLLADSTIDSVIYSTHYSCVNPNIYCGSNLPQINILNSPNVKLFVSHCGMESVLESINSTKPVLCVPLFADQPCSARRLSNLKVGDYLMFKDLNEDNLTKKVSKLLSSLDDSKMIALNSIMKINSKDSKERALGLILNYIQKSKSCNNQLSCYKPTIELKFYWQYYSLLLPAFLILSCSTFIALFIWIKALAKFMKLSKKGKSD